MSSSFSYSIQLAIGHVHVCLHAPSTLHSPLALVVEVAVLVPELEIVHYHNTYCNRSPIKTGVANNPRFVPNLRKSLPVSILCRQNKE